MEVLDRRLTPQVNPEHAVLSKSPFTDTTFPPSTQSLVHPSQIGRHGKLADYSWKRAKEIFGKKPFEVFEGIDINDIQQGALGDCYFLCSIAAVAEFPDRIMNLFLTKSSNDAGCYALTCYVMGQPRTIVLDDYFPYDNECRCLSFVKPKGNEIWVLLLEKAWAKVNGSFSNIVSGQGIEGLSFLTGAPCEYVTHDEVKNKDEIWLKIKAADEKDYIMTASGSGPLLSEEYTAVGLIKNHAYSLIGVKEVSYNGYPIRLVQLRNPWGEKEWNGEWSDSWPGWTPELKRRVELVEKNDGTFYMQFETFLKYYESTSICMWRDSYLHSTVTVNNKSTACHLFGITAETEGFIELCNFPERLLRTDFPGYKQPILSFIIGKIVGNTLRFIASAGCTSTSGNASVYLSPGSYVIFSTAHYQCDSPKSYVIHAYTSREINFVEHEWSQETYGELCKDYARTRKDKWGNKRNQIIIYTETEFNVGFGLVYLRNDTKDTEYDVTMPVEYKGMNMLYPTPNGGVVKGLIYPGDELVAISQITSPTSIGMSTSCRYSYSKTKKSGGPKVHEETKTFVGNALMKLRQIKPQVKVPQLPPSEPAPMKPQPSVYNPSPAPSSMPQPTTVPTYVPSANPPAQSHIYNPAPVPMPQPPTVPTYIPSQPPTYYPSLTMPYPATVPTYTPTQPSYPAQPSTYFPPQGGFATSVYPTLQPCEAKSTTTCASGHPLNYSYHEYPGCFYSCNICGTTNDCRLGRWFCMTCSYDVCNSCRPAIHHTAPAVDYKEKATKMCHKGHELKFTKFMYSYGEYKCDWCSTIGPCALGRWSCEACEYDICISCREPPASVTSSASKSPYCKFGHPLKFSFYSYSSGYYQCDFCSNVGACIKGRWFCQDCCCDVCSSCLAAPNLMCPRKHQLNYTNAVQGKVTYNCPLCKKIWLCSQGLLFCRDCGFSMCPDCIPALMNSEGKIAAEEPTHSDSSVFCDAGHPLFYSFSCVTGYQYTCRKCGIQDASSMGRWLCFSCDYSVCDRCVPKPTIVAENTADYYFCKLGHQLTFNRNPGQGTTYNCTQCGKRKSCAGGGFWCRKCRTAKCAQCIPISFIPNMSKCCTQGHTLVLTNAKGVETKEFFRCYMCGRGKPKAINYYRCPICDFNACGGCVQGTINNNFIIH
eukprot:TRINITY_DN64445_c0_g1_i1.p1 TRINITY_DN64445_c0_g1~~TRINITY_DN64445_c0_g1_i1.p1  ORF type:complete len:1204 (-),score=5.94 TRINITY_DN64445_c0_g1_i1:53-3520(-)